MLVQVNSVEDLTEESLTLFCKLSPAIGAYTIPFGGTPSIQDHPPSLFQPLGYRRASSDPPEERQLGRAPQHYPSTAFAGRNAFLAEHPSTILALPSPGGLPPWQSTPVLS